MKEKGVVLRIKKDRDWGEYQVQWWEDGKLDEGKTYFTDDEEDAIRTMYSVWERAKKGGKDIQWADKGYTRRLLDKNIQLSAELATKAANHVYLTEKEIW